MTIKSLLLNIALSFMFLLNVSIGHANAQSSQWFSRDAQNNVSITVDLFLSSTCPHCHKADAFFSELEKKQPWLVVHRYVINQDKSALQTFYEHLQRHHSGDFSVPAIFFCDSRWAGFADENTTGKVLLRALSYCQKKITQQGKLNSGTINALEKWGAASQVQVGSSFSQHAFSLIFFTALSDAFNPCSLFCLAAFFAFMWLYPAKKWQQFSIGATFIIFLGIAHYMQQVHSGFFYQNIAKWKLVAGLIGGLLLLTTYMDYRKMRLLKNVSPIILSLVVTVLTIFIVYIYQQTCELNLALVLEQWLTEQAISPIKRHLYQIIYQLVYLFPLILLLLFFFLFGNYHWLVRYQQRLKTTAYLILASIGIILLAYPTWLASFWISAIVFFGAIVAGWGWRQYEQIN